MACRRWAGLTNWTRGCDSIRTPPVTILQLKVLGASGVDSIYLEATVIERFWSSGYARIWQDLGIGTYCLQQRGDAVIATSVSPPIYLN